MPELWRAGPSLPHAGELAAILVGRVDVPGVRVRDGRFREVVGAGEVAEGGGWRAGRG